VPQMTVAIASVATPMRGPMVSVAEACARTGDNSSAIAIPSARRQDSPLASGSPFPSRLSAKQAHPSAV